jgi:hypothetical protein
MSPAIHSTFCWMATGMSESTGGPCGPVIMNRSGQPCGDQEARRRGTPVGQADISEIAVLIICSGLDRPAEFDIPAEVHSAGDILEIAEDLGWAA